MITYEQRQPTHDLRICRPFTVGEDLYHSIAGAFDDPAAISRGLDVRKRGSLGASILMQNTVNNLAARSITLQEMPTADIASSIAHSLGEAQFSPVWGTVLGIGLIRGDNQTWYLGAKLEAPKVVSEIDTAKAALYGLAKLDLPKPRAPIVHVSFAKGPNKPDLFHAVHTLEQVLPPRIKLEPIRYTEPALQNGTLTTASGQTR